MVSESSWCWMYGGWKGMPLHVALIKGLLALFFCKSSQQTLHHNLRTLLDCPLRQYSERAPLGLTDTSESFSKGILGTLSPTPDGRPKAHCSDPSSRKVLLPWQQREWSADSIWAYNSFRISFSNKKASQPRSCPSQGNLK